jgi:hypothetical protein
MIKDLYFIMVYVGLKDSPRDNQFFYIFQWMTAILATQKNS